jgi:hypothetical protein
MCPVRNRRATEPQPRPCAIADECQPRGTSRSPSGVFGPTGRFPDILAIGVAADIRAG